MPYSSIKPFPVVILRFLLVLLLVACTVHRAGAGEQSVEDSIVQVRLQIENIHQHTLSSVSDLSRAWDIEERNRRLKASLAAPKTTTSSGCVASAASMSST